MRRTERRRLDALVAILRPAGSLAARIAALPDQQCATYQDWQARMSEWIARRPNGQAYEAMINGEELPMLRREVRAALFQDVANISETAKLGEVQTIYYDFARGIAR